MEKRQITKGTSEDLTRYEPYIAMIYSAHWAVFTAIRRWYEDQELADPKQAEFRLWFDVEKMDICACVEQIEND